MDKKEILKWIKEVKDENEYYFDLSILELDEIPEEVFELTNLRHLNLAENNISKLSPSIGKLINLEGLVISSNNLTSLPKEIGKLKNLTSLFLSENQLETLPDELYELNKLTHLSLDNNLISHISPKIMQLGAIIELDLSDNNIMDLPYELSSLKYLSEEFNIDGNEIPYDSPWYTHSLSGIYQILKEREIENISILKIKVRKGIRQALKSYLSLFNEYVEDSKGVNLNLLIRDIGEDNLEIQLEKSGSTKFSEVNIYFSEYLSFLESKEIEIEKYITVESLKKESELLKLRIETQKNHFEQLLIIESTKSRLIQEDKEFLKKALLQSISSQPNYFQSQIQENFYLPQPNPSINLEKLFSGLKSIITALQPNESTILAEIKSLEELIEKSAITSKELNKTPKVKYKIFKVFDKLLAIVKNSKTVLIDSPKVTEKIKDIAIMTREFAEKAGDQYLILKDQVELLLKILNS